MRNARGVSATVRLAALAWAGAPVLGGLAAGVAQGQEPPQAEKQAAPAGGAAKPRARRPTHGRRRETRLRRKRRRGTSAGRC